MPRIRQSTGRRYRIKPGVVLVVGLLFLHGSVAAAATFKKLEIAKAYSDWNRLSAPIWDGSQAAPLNVEDLAESFDRDELVFIPTYGRFKRGGFKAKLGPAVRPGSIVAQLMRTEAEKMGLRLGQGGWSVGGAVTKIRLNNHTPSAWSMGVLLFYGYLELDLTITSPDGVESRETVGIHSYSVQAGGGIARDGIGTLLIEGAQEVLARLNRTHLEAPLHAAVGGMIERVSQGGVEGHEPLVYAIGLSGAPQAVPAFLDLLGREKDENQRSDLINALASLGSPDAVPTLSERYDSEEEDPRWYTLKALAYIGTDEALEVVRQKGLNDEEEYNRSLASVILGR